MLSKIVAEMTPMTTGAMLQNDQGTPDRDELVLSIGCGLSGLSAPRLSVVVVGEHQRPSQTSPRFSKQPPQFSRRQDRDKSSFHLLIGVTASGIAIREAESDLTRGHSGGNKSADGAGGGRGPGALQLRRLAGGWGGQWVGQRSPSPALKHRRGSRSTVNNTKKT